MEQSLLERLKCYQQSDYYPFHMPGHKRNSKIDYIPAGIDITEIEGFDDLHHPSSILLEAQKRTAVLYGAEESFFLVNGSTSGILSAISAVSVSDGWILLARNSHKAAYHGIFLSNQQVEYIYPEILDKYGIYGGINPVEIENHLKKNPAITSVLITSPTYEGMVSNIEKIADITHRYHRILIVDEAHGAHLHFGSGYFPRSAVSSHADIVIQSLHKTLPSLTQTAILHVQGSRVDRRKLKRYLSIYQTSSPSYVLMAGMDSCMQLLQTNGRKLFIEYELRLKQFYASVRELRHIHVLQPESVVHKASIRAMDPSKICIFTMDPGLTGMDLYQILLHQYHLQMEMVAGNYVIAMTSIMDREEGFERLRTALWEIDKMLDSRQGKQDVKQRWTETEIHTYIKTIRAEVVMTAFEAEKRRSKVMPITESEGMISQEYRYLYPPGVPVLVPGERITKNILDTLRFYQSKNLKVQGQESGENRITVVKE